MRRLADRHTVDIGHPHLSPDDEAIRIGNDHHQRFAGRHDAAVDETEVSTVCIAPVGESVEARALRLRQYEDFFNSTGMATPDDLTEFNNCQTGYGAGEGRYNEMSRGSTRWDTGPGKFGEPLDFNVVLSSPAVADEGLYVAIHDEWLTLMEKAIDSECSELAAFLERSLEKAR